MYILSEHVFMWNTSAYYTYIKLNKVFYTILKTGYTVTKMWLALSDQFPPKLLFIPSKMYILLYHLPWLQVFGWIPLCPYIIIVTYAVISVSLCDGEYDIFSIAKQFPQLDNLISSRGYEYSLVLYLHQYYLI